MEKHLILLGVLLVLLDSLAVQALRRFLMDFLIGQRNMKSARKIHAQQSLRDRITLSYIPSYLKRYASQFRFHHRVYLALLFTLVPQYLLVIISALLFGDGVRSALYVFCGIKLLLLVAIRLQVDSSLRSVYARKRK